MPASGPVINYADTSTPPPTGDFGLLGQHHSGMRTWRVEDDGHVLRIAAIPLLRYYIVSAVLVIASAAALGLLYPVLPSDTSERTGAVATAILILLAFNGAGLWIWFDILRAHRMQRQLGPWFELHRDRGLILLPRHAMQIALDRVVRVQEVTLAARPMLTRAVTELQLVHRDDSGEERVELILAGSSRSSIRGVAKPLSRTTSLAVIAVHRPLGQLHRFEMALVR